MTLRYATAQLITDFERELGRERESYVFFVAQDAIAPEFALSLHAGQSLEGATPVSESADGVPKEKAKEKELIVRPTPGTGIAFTVRSASGNLTHFVVLTQDQAERLTRLTIGGQNVLVYSGAYVFADAASLHVRSPGRSDIFFGLLAERDTEWQATTQLRPQAPEGVFHVYEARVDAHEIPVAITQTKPAGAAPPIERANPAGWRRQPVAVAPTDETMAKFAAEWSITLPKDALSNVEDIFLQIQYQGDVARLYTNTTLVDDNFYNGDPWVIGLKRFAPSLDAPLKLQVLPLPGDAPVYFDPGYKPQFKGSQIAAVASVTAVPEYEIVVRPQ